MTLGTQIAFYRKKQNITQEVLAQKLGVTNQAVSKWESEQCCPDVTLLAKIADIFEISLDELFGRAVPVSDKPVCEDDDDTLRVVLFRGGKRLEDQEICREVEIKWNGPVLNLKSDFAVSCDEVYGSVNAGGSVNCNRVWGNVHAGGNVSCDNVLGYVHAGGNVTCDDVEGNMSAGGNVTCDNIKGSVSAGRSVISESAE